MSSQDSNGIPLSYAPSSSGYKLLELPPEVLSLLESDAPPVLTLHPGSPAVLLKIPDGRTYSFRQKNTSNALTLLAPTTSRAASCQTPQPAGLSTVATLHDVIELVETASDAAGGRTGTAASAGEQRPALSAGKKGKWHEKFGRSR